ncbi:hypothetical protein E2C01_031282 [Portunus trituberculatus]|uniref:Uncharacterized protein n=1 Tax=Portunus trituberculatus TaxID=210409 RepID=A0A5B7ET17_PORTR|nr:hypothetical protein [Portunus trituberculatus]
MLLLDVNKTIHKTMSSVHRKMETEKQVGREFLVALAKISSGQECKVMVNVNTIKDRDVATILERNQ